MWRITFITICTYHTSKLRKKYFRNSKLLISRWLYVGDLNVLRQTLIATLAPVYKALGKDVKCNFKRAETTFLLDNRCYPYI